uniref:CASP-like protein n=1 Tax=Anthurium amnicola TaxID=1678845 RepID=A0A1D1Z525_9ARAE
MASQVYGGGGTTQQVTASYYDTAESSSRLVNYILRFVALAATFVAAIVMGVAKETKTILTNDGSSVDLQIKATGASQFDYFIAVNAIVCFYSAASLAMWVLSRGGSKGLALALTMVDLVVVAFLFSGLGSASAMGVLLRKGSGDLYPRVCNVYGKFCGRVAAAIVMSSFADVSYLAITVLSYLNLYKSSL